MNTDPAASTRDARPGAARELLINGAHLMALFSFAVVQPLLDVLKGDATFFVARRSQPADLLMLGLGLALTAPAMLLVVEALVGLVSRRLRQAVHLAFITTLIALVLLPPLKAFAEGSAPLLFCAFAGGALAALAYARLAPVRSFLTMLAPAPLVFGALFLLHPSISKLLGSGPGEVVPTPQISSQTTVVFVILDELPVTSLIDEDWEIDSTLFPNFARLASRSTWFRNATSNHHASQHAIPGILTGMLPADPERLPIAVDHPRNLFSLLASSYRMNIWETFSGLWTQGSGDGTPFGVRMESLIDDLAVVYGHIVLPEKLAVGLPDIDATWGGFRTETPEAAEDALSSESAGHHTGDEAGRGGATQPFGATEEFKSRTSVVRGFIESIDGEDEPTLHFLHVLLPHTPWERLPTGQRYSVTSKWDYGRVRSEWSKDGALVAQSFQRHLLQVGHSDLLLGELLDRLEAHGVYDRCLFVLVADHGCSIRPKQPFRSSYESQQSVREVLHVPLFVKVPFQREAHVSDRNVQAMDILPTIADALELEMPWDVDGRSAFDTETPELDEKVIHFLRAEQARTVPAALPTSWAALDDKLRLFGAAPGWDGVYAFGPHPDLVGRPVEDFEGLAPIAARLDLVDAYRFTSIDVAAEALPAFVQGEITRVRPTGARGAQPPLPTEIAVALNGTIRAVTSTHHRSTRKAVFSAMLPPAAFQEGRNSVEVFGIFDGVKLAPIRGVSYEIQEGRIIASDGRVFEIGPSPLKLSRAILSARSRGLGVTGWAADFDANRPADSVLIFLGDECAISGPLNHPRPDLEDRFDGKHGHAGFNYVLPVELPRDEILRQARVFVLLDSSASELKLQP